jgi:pimeloyl-ACP methyl ester carboxylesterase
MMTSALISTAMTTVLLGFTRTMAFGETERVNTGDYVVLLHGMDRTALSMMRAEFYLKRQGYQIINVNYPSRRYTVEQLSENYLAPLLEKKITDKQCRVHFVTHSLGGIIVRQYLATHSLSNIGRVVMLGPPNHGSGIINFMRSHALTRIFLSATGHELGTTEKDLPARLGPVTFECGVIAGDRSLNPFLSAFLNGPNDGKVTVESAKVSGMRDFLKVHFSHTWLMWREATLRQTLTFLQTGYFHH